MIIEILEIALAVYLASVLVIAGLAKIADQVDIFAMQALHLKSTISALGKPLTVSISMIEIVLGLLLISGFQAFYVSLAVVFVFLLFLLLKLRLYIKKKNQLCWCYGPRYVMQADKAGLVISMVQLVFSIALLLLNLLFTWQSFQPLRIILIVLALALVTAIALNQRRQKAYLSGY
jgi:hypothetical protein